MTDGGSRRAPFIGRCGPAKPHSSSATSGMQKSSAGHCHFWWSSPSVRICLIRLSIEGAAFCASPSSLGSRDATGLPRPPFGAPPPESERSPSRRTQSPPARALRPRARCLAHSSRGRLGGPAGPSPRQRPTCTRHRASGLVIAASWLSDYWSFPSGVDHRRAARPRITAPSKGGEVFSRPLGGGWADPWAAAAGAREDQRCGCGREGARRLSTGVHLSGRWMWVNRHTPRFAAQAPSTHQSRRT